jgi:hypothetical protein
MNAQKQLILGRQSFHFAVNRISCLEGCAAARFLGNVGWQQIDASKRSLKKQLFSPESKLLPRTAPFGV